VIAADSRCWGKERKDTTQIVLLRQGWGHCISYYLNSRRRCDPNGNQSQATPRNIPAKAWMVRGLDKRDSQSCWISIHQDSRERGCEYPARNNRRSGQDVTKQNYLKFCGISTKTTVVANIIVLFSKCYIT
jgi:hypothetical protein